MKGILNGNFSMELELDNNLLTFQADELSGTVSKEAFIEQVTEAVKEAIMEQTQDNPSPFISLDVSISDISELPDYVKEGESE